MIYNKPIELFTILGEVVNSMRQTNTITSFTEVNGLYTLISDNTLSNSDYITIDSLQFKVKNVTETQFQVKYTTGTDFLNKIWKANAPYFMHEKEAKAGEVLTEKTKQDTYKYQKYPLFLLVRPYTDSRDNQMIGYSADFNLYIITNTEQTYWSNDRVNKNFEPTLYPLYEDFINKLIEHRYIKEKFADKLNHSKTDLMFIDGNPFPDKMDGLNISFTGLEVLKPARVCEPITPKQYSLTLNSDANGSVQPFEGTQLRNVNETIAINATPNVDSLFKRWLINGIESFINPTWVKMTNNITAIAEFFRTFTLNISSVGNGSTIPATGSYEYEDGETVQIEAIPDENNQFDNFDIDGLIITDNPYQLVMDSLKNIVANFIVSGGFGDYYQWLPLGLEDNLANKGTGLSPVDGLLISGAMATQDIEFDWIRGDAGLQAVADAYGVVNPMTYQGLVGFNGYNHPYNIEQLFFKEQPYFENDELKDYSNNHVNADIWGYALKPTLSGLATMTIENEIPINYLSDGLNWEFITSFDNTATSRIYSNKIRGLGLDISSSFFTQFFDTADGSNSYVNVFITIPSDNSLFRIKSETIGSIIRISLTSEFNDENYINGTIIDVPISSITNLEQVIPTHIDKLAPFYQSIHGYLAYANLAGHIWTFEDNPITYNGNAYFESGYVYSINSINRIYVFEQGAGLWSLVKGKCFNKHGFTRIYLTNTNSHLNLSYNNGVSRINEYITNYNPIDYYYEEFPVGKFGGNGYAFSLKDSQSSIGEPYFTGGVPNKILSNSQPTLFDNKTRWDRGDSGVVIVHDLSLNIEASKNLVGKRLLFIGDSVAGNNHTKVLASKTGMTLTLAFYGGQTTTTILDLLTDDVASNPTLISDQDFIFINCCFNDYGQGKTQSQLITDYDSLVKYVLSENSAADIICDGVYNWMNDISDPTVDDGTTPNAGGMTRDDIREIIENTANANNTHYCNLNDANIVKSDLTEGVHPGTSSGNLKCANVELDSLLKITEGTEPLLIPESDLRVTEKDGVFTDWAVQPYANYQVLEGDFKTTDGVYPVIKDF